MRQTVASKDVNTEAEEPAKLRQRVVMLEKAVCAIVNFRPFGSVIFFISYCIYGL